MKRGSDRSPRHLLTGSQRPPRSLGRRRDMTPTAPSFPIVRHANVATPLHPLPEPVVPPDRPLDGAALVPSPRIADAWTARLLGDGAGSAGWAHEARRLGIGIGLASIFGLAVGLRFGGFATATHAFGVSAGFVSI